MKQLFQRRCVRHVLRMTKYLKYVFNDFFVLALIFFVGGLGLAYAHFLQHFRAGQVGVSVVIGLVMLLSVQAGRLATFIRRPDPVFLLPRDRSLRSYFRGALVYSFINAAVVQGVVGFLLIPLWKLQFHAGIWGISSWFVIMLSLKLNWLLAAAGNARQAAPWWNRNVLHRWLWPVVVIALGMVTAPGAAGVSLVGLAGHALGLRRFTAPVDWRYLVRAESRRMHLIYQVFNLFVDVPQLGSAVQRRRYLNPLLRLVRPVPRNVYRYLYWHGFARDQEFSDLYLRLTGLGILILWFVNGNVLPIVMGIVFIYLIGFQLVPFYFHFDANVMLHMYPLGQQNQLASFQQLVAVLLSVSGGLFAVTFLLAGRGWLFAVLNLVLLGTEVVMLTKGLVPRKVKQARAQRRIF